MNSREENKKLYLSKTVFVVISFDKHDDNDDDDEEAGLFYSPAFFVCFDTIPK